MHLSLADLVPWVLIPADGSSYASNLALLCERVTPALLDFTGEFGEPLALDLGCGAGAVTFLLARAFPHVLGIDSDPRLVAAASLLKAMGELEVQLPLEGTTYEKKTVRLPADVEPEAVRFRVGDVTALPPELQPVDCLLASNLLEGLPNPKEFLQKVPQLLRPNGVFVLASTYDWGQAPVEGGYRHPFEESLVGGAPESSRQQVI